MMFGNVGLPLTDIFEILKSNELQPDFYTFILEAKKSGWSNKGIYSRLEESIVDSYGKDYWKEIKKKLDKTLYNTR